MSYHQILPYLLHVYFDLFLPSRTLLQNKLDLFSYRWLVCIPCVPPSSVTSQTQRYS